MKKTILVSGANRGIGLAITRGLAAQGYHVLMACRDTAKGAGIAATVDGEIDVVALDLSQPNSIHQQVEQILKCHPRIHALINNAAILTGGDATNASLEDFQHSLEVNLMAPFALIQAILPTMQAQQYGRIVNLSSGWGSFYENLEGPFSYAVSKAALNALTVKFAQAMPEGVKINAACPGWVRTDMGGADANLSPEEGADTPIWLATLDDEGPNGQFFRDRKAISW